MAVAVGGEESAGEGGVVWASGSRPHEDLCTRTSWADARTALAHINKGRATGSRATLWVRTKLQYQLLQLGTFSQRHAGKVLFVALLVLATFCVGLKSATLLTNVQKLWVEEGGRLEQELAYVEKTLGEGYGTTKQILILTPKDPGANVLHPKSLLAHAAVLKAATSVKIEMYEMTWSLADLCYAPSFPELEHPIIDPILEKLTPCTIITPLDCFWEGSKLLGPETPVTIPGLGPGVNWTNLNPQKIVDKMKMAQKYKNAFPFSFFADFMKRAGVTTAYQEKPCLDPSDPMCPSTAPNKESKQPPDVGAELTGGCYGFAGKYMHWPEDLIVGATQTNKTGHIVRAEALQSMIQLMGARNLYEYWSDDYKVQYMDWSQEKAARILGAWQHKFTQTVLEETTRLHNETKFYNMLPFSSANLDDLLRDFSEVPASRVALGYVLMVVYACLSLVRLNNCVHSSAGLGFAGVLLVAVTVAAGLGFCALLGFPFNASTTQVLPFLALGLGVDDMFLMAHTFAETADNSHIPYQERVGEVLKRAGVSVVLTSVCNACAFFAGALVPVPALRSFCMQAALLVLVNLVSTLTVFPAIMSLDLRRRHAHRTDILCCIPGGNRDQVAPIAASGHYSSSSSGRRQRDSSSAAAAEEGRSWTRHHHHHHTSRQHHPTSTVPKVELPKKTTVTRALPPPGGGTVTQVVPPTSPRECWASSDARAQSAPSLESLATNNSTRDLVNREKLSSGLNRAWASALQYWSDWSIGRWMGTIYGPTLMRGEVKAAAIIGLFVSVGAAAWGVSNVEDGLDLTDVVPRSAPEFAFLSAQQKYFGFYNMFAVTQGNFEYPTKQRLLHDYYEAFTRVNYIIKNDDGGLPEFWLSLFRDWLIGLQNAFDHDWRTGCITQETWHSNASDEGILAYKLLVQTGHADNPIDLSLVSQIRLVNSEGIINPKAFYNYLTAWATNDALAYTASQADLRPEPRHWTHDRYDFDLKIPKSPPLVYTQLPFYLHQLSDTATITTMIGEVRAICKRFEDRGLPNFPTGVPFTFWEQYIKLRFYLVLAILAVLTAVFLVLAVVLMNLWAAALVVLLLATLVFQLFGLFGILGVKLSAVPAVLLIVSVGVGVEFCVHVTVGFLTAVGGRERRVVLALQHMATPVLHGAASTLLASLMLLFSEFEFIRKYFFYVLLALTVLGVLDGLIFLPVLLSLVGPPAEVVPRNHLDRLPTPSPPPSPQASQSHSHHSHSSRRSHHGSSMRGCSGRSSSSRRSSGCAVGGAVGGAGGGGGGGGCGSSSSMYPRLHGSNLSLTTITEEPPSSTRSSQSLRSSHEIVVEPQVVVETTTTTPSAGGNGDTHLDHHVTTKVTATAKVKVELHTQLPGAVEPTYRTSSSSSSSSGGTRRSSRRSSNGSNCSNGAGGVGNSPCNSSSSSSSSSSSCYGTGSSPKGSSDVEECFSK
ncbi:protein patched [Macrobrachium rosenbergii]|uniref:protein patched n=1 Tax=Macrobrachium rosenbergii TaxID=79674 RepID=UPI0034D5360B